MKEWNSKSKNWRKNKLIEEKAYEQKLYKQEKNTT